MGIVEGMTPDQVTVMWIILAGLAVTVMWIIFRITK